MSIPRPPQIGIKLALTANSNVIQPPPVIAMPAFETKIISTPIRSSLKLKPSDLSFDSCYQEMEESIKRIRWPNNFHAYLNQLTKLHDAYRSDLLTVQDYGQDYDYLRKELSEEYGINQDKINEFYQNYKSNIDVLTIKQKEIQKKKEELDLLDVLVEQSRKNLIEIQSDSILGRLVIHQNYKSSGEIDAIKNQIIEIRFMVKQIVKNKEAVLALNSYSGNYELGEMILITYDAEAENILDKAERGRILKVALVRLDTVYDKVNGYGCGFYVINTKYHELHKQEIELIFRYKQEIQIQKGQEKIAPKQKSLINIQKTRTKQIQDVESVFLF